jgi:hypothetical protein
MVKGGLVMVKSGSAGSLPAPRPASRLRSQGRTGFPSESYR